MLKKNRGQSTMEYIIVVTAIVAAVIAVAVTIGNQDAGGGAGLSKLFKQSGDKIKTESKKILDMVP